MSLCLVIISDGRDDVHQRALVSAADCIPFELVDQIVTVDDREHQLGFAGAIRQAWDQVVCDWVLHLEADFTFNAPVDVAGMIALLERQPQLAQVALKRQPWNADERAAGGIVEQHPDDYIERTDRLATWTEHRRFFTTNPSIYPSRLIRLGWPQEPQSEGLFTHRLLRDPLLRFAFWGGKHDAPLVHHIGDTRAGTGY